LSRFVDLFREAGTKFDAEGEPDNKEIGMNIATAFAKCTKEEIKALLDGGTLTIYSVARPVTADLAVDRSGVLATFTFATPAFGAESGEFETRAPSARPASRAPARPTARSSLISPPVPGRANSSSPKSRARSARPPKWSR
jgi:hypothetical protein